MTRTTRRWVRPYPGVLIVALSLMAVVAGTASAAPSTPDAARTIRYRVLDALQTPLTVMRSQPQYGHWRNTPAGADYLGLDDSTLLSTNGWAEATVRYRIGSSALYVDTYSNNPPFGNNYNRCMIVDDKGQETTSPYRCEYRSHGGSDFDSDFVVEPKDAATHKLTDDERYTRRFVLDALCSPTAAMTYVSCEAATDGIEHIWTGLGPQTLVSNLLLNCSSSTARQDLSYAQTEGETNTVGTKAEVGGTLYKKVNVKLEVSYQHSWQRSNTVGDRTSVTAQPGEYAWLTNAMLLQNVKGTFVLQAGNQTYVARDITVSAPSTQDPANLVIAHSERITDPAAVCAGRSTEFQLPSAVAPVTTRTYTIALATANQRLITVPGATRQSGHPVRIDAPQGDRHQRWTFDEMPSNPGYYLVRSDNDPDLCLDLSGADGRSVLQYTCHDEPNQQWEPVFDPGSNSYRLVSAAGGATIATNAVTPDTPVIATTGSASHRQWQFTRTTP